MFYRSSAQQSSRVFASISSLTPKSFARTGKTVPAVIGMDDFTRNQSFGMGFGLSSKLSIILYGWPSRAKPVMPLGNFSFGS